MAYRRMARLHRKDYLLYPPFDGSIVEIQPTINAMIGGVKGRLPGDRQTQGFASQCRNSPENGRCDVGVNR